MLYTSHKYLNAIDKLYKYKLEENRLLSILKYCLPIILKLTHGFTIHKLKIINDNQIK